MSGIDLNLLQQIGLGTLTGQTIGNIEGDLQSGLIVTLKGGGKLFITPTIDADGYVLLSLTYQLRVSDTEWVNIPLKADAAQIPN